MFILGASYLMNSGIPRINFSTLKKSRSLIDISFKDWLNWLTHEPFNCYYMSYQDLLSKIKKNPEGFVYNV